MDTEVPPSIVYEQLRIEGRRMRDWQFAVLKWFATLLLATITIGGVVGGFMLDVGGSSLGRELIPWFFGGLAIFSLTIALASIFLVYYSNLAYEGLKETFLKMEPKTIEEDTARNLHSKLGRLFEKWPRPHHVFLVAMALLGFIVTGGLVMVAWAV